MKIIIRLIKIKRVKYCYNLIRNAFEVYNAMLATLLFDELSIHPIVLIV